ncbi:MAG: Arm DNA-binding domain-containing protein [Actinobacteria bacterium]|nr:Arm DNA-binding domain-containing protein [Actinomycetota bacterium]
MQGHIHKRTHTNKSGHETVKWYVIVDLGRDYAGKRRQKWHGSYRTRKEAEVARAKIVGELHEGSYSEPVKLTFGDWVIDRWLPTMRTQVKPSTFESYSRNARQHVLPRIGGRQLREIGPGQLNTLYADLLDHGRQNGEGGLSPKTVRYIHTIVHKALADARDAGLVASNVAERAKPPRPRAMAPTELRFWTPAELRTFLDLVREHRLVAAWHVSAMTGMRRGEVLGLRWADVDLDAARIHVRQALVSVANELVMSTPKTHRARVIDRDAGTVNQLRRHRDERQTQTPGALRLRTRKEGCQMTGAAPRSAAIRSRRPTPPGRACTFPLGMRCFRRGTMPGSGTQGSCDYRESLVATCGGDPFCNGDRRVHDRAEQFGCAQELSSSRVYNGTLGRRWEHEGPWRSIRNPIANDLHRHAYSCPSNGRDGRDHGADDRATANDVFAQPTGSTRFDDQGHVRSAVRPSVHPGGAHDRSF